MSDTTAFLLAMAAVVAVCLALVVIAPAPDGPGPTPDVCRATGNGLEGCLARP